MLKGALVCLIFLIPYAWCDFYGLCQPVQKYQISFNGRCDISRDKFHVLLNETRDFILNSDESLTLDDFIRNVYFKDTTNYFKIFYADYIADLDDFTKELNLVADKVTNGIGSITVEYLLTSHRRSGFNNTLNLIKKDIDQSILLVNQNETLNDTEKEEYRNNKTCRGNSFCNDIEDFFGLTNLETIKTKKLDEFLKYLNDFVYRRMGIFTSAGEKVANDVFIDRLKDFGTSKVLVKELIDILKQKFFDEIINQLNPGFEPTDKPRSTRTKRPTVSTTPKPAKVNKDSTPVPIEVIVSVPLSLLLLGIIVSGIIAFFVYGFVPIQYYEERNNTIRQENNAQVFSIEMKPKTSHFVHKQA